jgi:hypothetical protein
MRQPSFRFVAVFVCGTVALTNMPTAANDKKDEKDQPALSGVWSRKGAELKIEFSDKDVMKIFPHGDNEAISLVCKYSIAKEGLVKAKLTEFEGKQEVKDKVKELVPLGLEFTFKWNVKDDTATLGDVKGEKSEILKAHLEGDYEEKK